MPLVDLSHFRHWALTLSGMMVLLAGANCDQVCANDGGDSTDWPQWRGAGRTGVVATILDVAEWGDRQPQQLWEAEVGTGFSSIVVSAGRAFTVGNMDDHDVVWAFDAATGKVLWKHSSAAPLDPNLFEGGPTSTPTVVDGRVYTLSRRGEVRCLTAAEGQLLWSVDVRELTEANLPSWGFASSPLVIENRVLLNVGSAGLALEAKTGALLWKSDNSDDAGYASPVPIVLHDRDQMLIASGKAVSAVDIATGKVAWSYRWITRYGVNAADPHVIGEYVLLSSGYAKGSTLLKLTEAEPEEVWRSRALRNQMSPGVVIDGHLYAVDGDAGDETSLRCVNVMSGEVTWTADDLGSATLIAAGGHLLVLSGSGELVVVPAISEKFEPVFRQQLLTGKCWTPPALAGGNLYVRNAAGHLVCWKVSK